MNFSSRKYLILAAISAFLVIAIAPAVKAQTLDTGSLQGRVTDGKGSPLPGAVVRAKGPQGTKAAQTDDNGNYHLPFLTTGAYEVTVSMDGYSTQVQTGVQINARETRGLPIRMAEGAEVIVVRAQGGVDVHSTTGMTSINLADAVKVFAQDRSFTAAFDFSAGSISDSGVGGGNPSIAGASGLENQYFINGINITSAGYGSIGAYDVFGPRGSGMSVSFLESVDIKDGGFEAEFGGALGGTINATVKSGSNDFHGAAEVYYQPRSLNGGGGSQFDHGYNQTDVSLTLGGPIVRDRLFFFVGYNPIWKTRYFFDGKLSDEQLALDGNIAPYLGKEFDTGRNLAANYAAHLTWQITDKHKLDFVYVGSPQSKSGTIVDPSIRVDSYNDPGLTGLPRTSAAEGALGTRRITDDAFSIQYFGTLAPWLNVEAQATRHIGRVKEIPTGNANNTYFGDNRRNQLLAAQLAENPPVTPTTSGAYYETGGLGSYQGGTNDQTSTYTLKFTSLFSLLGSHELKVGAQFTELKFRQELRYSGGEKVVSLDLGASYNPYAQAIVQSGSYAIIGCPNANPYAPTLATACPTPNYTLYGGTISPKTPDTLNRDLAIFAQDSWTIKNVTLKLGARYVHERIKNPQEYTLLNTQGTPLVKNGGAYFGTRLDYYTCPAPAPGQLDNPACYPDGPSHFRGGAYDFPHEISASVGLSWDVMGNGKSKMYFNLSRQFERIPNDLAVRSFGNELSLSSARFGSPDFTNGSQAARARIFGTEPTVVVPGTRLPYKDDYLLGYQFKLTPQVTVDLRANYRKQGRVLEDTQGASAEATLNYYYNYLIPYGYCLNCAPGQTELFPGFGSAPFGQYVLANVGENAPSSFPDYNNCPDPSKPDDPACSKIPITFGHPKSEYQAISMTVQKTPAEGQHVAMQMTYRYAKVYGNYEGLYRNDNGQSDPNITSLYDLPDTPLTHGQFLNGPLNTDTPHSLRVNIAYNDLFTKGMYGALTFKWQSGQPRTSLLAHPVYQNAGEIPGINPDYYHFYFNGYGDYYILKSVTPVERGNLGRTSDSATWDVKYGYRWKAAKSEIDINILVFNIFNNVAVVHRDDNVESQSGFTNPYYGQPTSYHVPRQVRLGLSWNF